MNESTVSSKNKHVFLKRIWIYSKEMFPVLIYLPYLIALYICLNFSSQAISGHDIVVDSYGILGFVSAFFVMLMMRTFDDLKDFDLDKDLFPWRATAKGDVKRNDIRIISFISFSILIIANVLFGMDTIVIFIIMMVYALLTFYWFFNEEIHRKNLFLTMADHQPLPYMINFFLIHTALASGDLYDPFTLNQGILLLIFSLPVTAWEVSRKIRSADKETHYETFSLVIGLKPATWVALICLLLAGGLTVYIGNVLDLAMSFYLICSLLMLGVIFIYGRFLMNPTDKNNILTTVAMVFTSLLFFNMLGHVIVGHAVIMNI